MSSIGTSCHVLLPRCNLSIARVETTGWVVSCAGFLEGAVVAPALFVERVAVLETGSVAVSVMRLAPSSTSVPGCPPQAHSDRHSAATVKSDTMRVFIT